MIKRRHLFEFEDQAWFPGLIRDGGTDFLGFLLKLLDFYKPAIKILEEAIVRSGRRQVLDLCSGNGGPVAYIARGLPTELHIRFVLSDKFPNLQAYQEIEASTKGHIGYFRHPVDALDPGIDIPGFRTMFSAIHHFKPEEVTVILKNAVDNGMPIGIFDGGDKHLGTVIGILLFHPLLFLFCTPFIRPFRFSRLLFTYLIPLIPLFTIWDGAISIFRLYRPEALMRLAQVADPERQYTLECGKQRNRFGLNVAYLIGIPVSRSRELQP